MDSPLSCQAEGETAGVNFLKNGPPPTLTGSAYIVAGPFRTVKLAHGPLHAEKIEQRLREAIQAHGFNTWDRHAGHSLPSPSSVEVGIRLVGRSHFGYQAHFQVWQVSRLDAVFIAGEEELKVAQGVCHHLNKAIIMPWPAFAQRSQEPLKVEDFLTKTSPLVVVTELHAGTITLWPGQYKAMPISIISHASGAEADPPPLLASYRQVC